MLSAHSEGHQPEKQKHYMGYPESIVSDTNPPQSKHPNHYLCEVVSAQAGSSKNSTPCSFPRKGEAALIGKLC